MNETRFWNRSELSPRTICDVLNGVSQKTTAASYPRKTPSMNKNLKQKTQVGSPQNAHSKTPLGAIAAFALLVLIVSAIGFALYPPSTPPVDPVQSVVVVDTEIKLKVDPLAFFLFGRGSFKGHDIPAPLLEITDGPPKEAPPVYKIVHAGGAGFVVNGRLITAAHVVYVAPDSGGEIIKITVMTYGGETRVVKVDNIDTKADLAELVIAEGEKPLGVPHLTLSSRTPLRGDALTEIGHPEMIRFVVSKGFLVGFDREQGYNIAALDTFHGNSGGPVLDASGEVVGVAHTIIEGTRFTGIGTLQALRDFLNPDETR